MGVVAAFALPHPPLAAPGAPEEGRGRIAHTVDAMREASRRLRDLAPETVVVVTPHATSHADRILLAGGEQASGELAGTRYEAAYDVELVERVRSRAGRMGVECDVIEDDELDPGTLVPLAFVLEAFEEREYLAPLVVRCSIAGPAPDAHYRLGEVVAVAAEETGRRVAVVASANLSHRLSETSPLGWSPDGPLFDSMACGALGSGSFLPLLTCDRAFAESAGECGLRPLQVLAGALDETRVTCDLMSYEAPFGVGYAVASFVPTTDVGSDPSRDFLSAYERWAGQELERRREGEDAFVSLAREALESYVLTGERMEVPEGLPAELAEPRAGAFVTLWSSGELRCCVGTLAPQRSTLAAEVCANAVAAARGDRQAPHVAADELDDLVYEVDVVHDPEPCGIDGLDPARYGVVVSTPDGRRGMMLPGLPGIGTVEEQVGAAALRGGIALGRDEVSYRRFLVTRHR